MHAIQEFDKGRVQRASNGEGTWHGIPSYIVVDRPVTIEEAQKVMCYPLEKQRLSRNKVATTDFEIINEEIEAWCIVRTDHDVVLVPHVGARFEVLNNSFLLDFISEHLFTEFTELGIESVGTLFNGATAFVNLKVDEFQVKGDKSPTLSRLMYYNPLGSGCYKACAHDVRIVCNNTLRQAEGEGKTNKTLAKFRHTANAANKINEHLEALAEVKLGLKKHIYTLEALQKKEIVSSKLAGFLNRILPLPVDDNGKQLVECRAWTMVHNKRDALLDIYNSDQQIDPPNSAYALLQATTNWLDHGKIKSGDDMACKWDGIVGQRANIKDMALDFLVNV